MIAFGRRVHFSRQGNMFDFVTDLRGMTGMFYMSHSHVERMHTYLDLSLDMRYKVVKIISSGK